MPEHVVIDGTNLWHAIQNRAAGSSMGRERLVRLIEHWAGESDRQVTLVFDGAAPRGGLAVQMESNRFTVRFSAPRIADDIIVDLINAAPSPRDVRVVSSDNAVGHAARYRRCYHTPAIDFIEELLGYVSLDKPAPADSGRKPHGQDTSPVDKPDSLSPHEARQWLKTFGFDPNEQNLFEGYDAMNQ